MPTDLTERLAAKLHPWLTHFTGGGYVREALVPDLLPLLLSEPELVASLPDAVRLSVLTPRERAVMKLGEAHLWRVAVLTDLDARKNEKLNYASRVNLDDALTEARALSAEAKE